MKMLLQDNTILCLILDLFNGSELQNTKYVNMHNCASTEPFILTSFFAPMTHARIGKRFTVQSMAAT